MEIEYFHYVYYILFSSVTINKLLSDIKYDIDIIFGGSLGEEWIFEDQSLISLDLEILLFNRFD